MHSRVSFWRRALVLSLLLSVSQRTAAQAWPEEYSEGPFVYHGDFPLAPYRPLLAGISNLQIDVPETLGIAGAQEPVHLFLFSRKSTYQRYLREHFPTVPMRRALFIKQRGPGMVFAHTSADFAVDLRHETTHAVLHGALPIVPLWLDEGLAEYFEIDPEQRARDNPHLSSVRWNARWGRAPSLTRLEQINDLARMQAEDYRSAWAWVHFMLHGPSQANAALQGYLRDIQAHTPAGRLSDRLYRSVPSLRSSFLHHFQQWNR